jgi:hypothetical protein
VSLAPGLYPAVDAATYHNDPCEQPSLSASIAHTLVTRTPLHAWTAHPRLNPNYEKTAEDKFDLGTVVHSLVLQGIDVMEILPFPDYRTAAAKEARDLARQHGRIPILVKQAAEVEAMVTAVWEQLAGTGVFEDGQPEVTAVWDENGVGCRGRIDWLTNSRLDIFDLKTTTRSARGSAWSKGPLFDHGCDIQAAAYRSAVRTLTGKTPDWHWVVVETAPPYALQIIEPGADVLTYGEARWAKALELWKRCLDSGVWPGYGTDPWVAELPAYVEAAWLEREAREELAA